MAAAASIIVPPGITHAMSGNGKPQTTTPYNPYQTGWDDGYAEGYAVKLVDVTDPFMPPKTDFQVEAAARWLHFRMAAHISYPEAIGLVRGMVREGMKV